MVDQLDHQRDDDAEESALRLPGDLNTSEHLHLKMRQNLLARLRRDTSGVAMLEFAFSMPIVLSLGLLGVETSNYALIHLKVSQIALTLADNAARVGMANTLNQQQLREVDMNDVLQATALARRQHQSDHQGRVIISSLENVQQTYDTVPVQRVIGSVAWA